MTKTSAAPRPAAASTAIVVGVDGSSSPIDALRRGARIAEAMYLPPEVSRSAAILDVCSRSHSGIERLLHAVIRPDQETAVVQRIVVRHGPSLEKERMLLKDTRRTSARLDDRQSSTPGTAGAGYGFHHDASPAAVDPAFAS